MVLLSIFDFRFATSTKQFPLSIQHLVCIEFLLNHQKWKIFHEKYKNTKNRNNFIEKSRHRVSVSVSSFNTQQPACECQIEDPFKEDNE